MSKPKRFVVFVFDQFYPRGGWKDLTSSFDTMEEAIASMRTEMSSGSRNLGDQHIVDLETGEQIDFKDEAA